MSIYTEPAPLPSHHPDNFQNREVHTIPELVKKAGYDALTESRNRHWLDDNLPRILEQNHSNVALLSVDIDGLKEKNDTEGHAEGDDLLVGAVIGMRRAGKELDTLRQDSTERPSDIVVARVGGDEFNVVLFGIENDEQLEVVTNKVRSELEAEGVSASIGGVVHNGEDAQELKALADKKMYDEKAIHKQERFNAELAKLSRVKRIAAKLGIWMLNKAGIKQPR